MGGTVPGKLLSQSRTPQKLYHFFLCFSGAAWWRTGGTASRDSPFLPERPDFVHVEGRVGDEDGTVVGDCAPASLTLCLCVCSPLPGHLDTSTTMLGRSCREASEAGRAGRGLSSRKQVCALCPPLLPPLLLEAWPCLKAQRVMPWGGAAAGCS